MLMAGSQRTSGLPDLFGPEGKFGNLRKCHTDHHKMSALFGLLQKKKKKQPTDLPQEAAKRAEAGFPSSDRELYYIGSLAKHPFHKR